MHVELLDILATCPARLYESCSLHEDVLAAVGQPEPQPSDPEKEFSPLDVFFQNNSMNSHVEDAVSILDYLCANLSLRPADRSNVELLKCSLDWLGKIAVVADKKGTPLSKDLCQGIEDSPFMRCVTRCDQTILFLENWAEGDIPYFLSRDAFFWLSSEYDKP